VCALLFACIFVLAT